MAPTFRMSVIEGRISAILNAATSGAPPPFLSAVPARAWSYGTDTVRLIILINK